MTRRDYWHDPTAPRPNSLVVAVSAVVRDDVHRLLLIRRTDTDVWSLPGGAVEPGEALSEAVHREVYEETGYETKAQRLLGIFSDPGHIVEYNDGEIRQEFSVLFESVTIGGHARPSAESSDVQWVPLDRLPALNLHPAMRHRIDIGLNSKIPYFT